MEKNSTQQEVLLVTGTSFSSRAWCEKDESDNNNKPTPREQLEEACWNGWLNEMLPELFEEAANAGVYLWKIKEAGSFLEIELGEFPDVTDKYFSIDPYSFQEHLCNN